MQRQGQSSNALPNQTTGNYRYCSKRQDKKLFSPIGEHCRQLFRVPSQHIMTTLFEIMLDL